MATPTNRNYLSGITFKFNIERCPHVEFFTQSVTTPEMRIGTIEKGTPFNIYKLPGDELYYGELLIKFVVDEDLNNYNEIAQWIRFITNPEANEFCNSAYRDKYGDEHESNATLYTLNSNFNSNVLMTFKGIYPTYLSSLMFDSTFSDEQFQFVEVNFKVNGIDLFDKEGNPMWLNI